MTCSLLWFNSSLVFILQTALILELELLTQVHLSHLFIGQQAVRFTLRDDFPII